MRHHRLVGSVARRPRPRSVAILIATSILGWTLTGSAQASTLAGASAIHVISQSQLDARLTAYTLSTPALTSTTPLRVLLPTGYAQHPKEHYPVLYLLHGCCSYDVSGAASWTVHGDAEALTAGLPVIVVMPDDGQGGFYTDWYNNGHPGPPDWETYDIDELIPWVQANFRTVPTRGGRAVVGLSMGGFGAMSLAARHPDLFSLAASFSGVVDNHNTEGTFQAVDEALAVQDGGAPGSIWGSYATDAVRWWGSDPVDLAGNLRGLALVVRTGNGLPGGPFGGGPDAIEATAESESEVFNDQLSTLGIPHVWDDYGPGAHQWPYWTRDLKETLPEIMATFTHPPAPPRTVTFTSIEPQYSVYGWQVALNRGVLEFSTLSGATTDGFTLSGSGSATVTTPRILKAGQSARVTVTPSAAAAQSVTLKANSAGELTVSVPLGPANTEQQGLPGAVTNVYATQVGITAIPVKRARKKVATTTTKK